MALKRNDPRQKMFRLLNRSPRSSPEHKANQCALRNRACCEESTGSLDPCGGPLVRDLVDIRQGDEDVSIEQIASQFQD
jgi:hypothetical protein